MDVGPGQSLSCPLSTHSAQEIWSRGWGSRSWFPRASFFSVFRKIKTLGEDDPWLDDTAAWIERSRQLQKEKDLAEKRVRCWGSFCLWWPDGWGAADGPWGREAGVSEQWEACAQWCLHWVPRGLLV